MPMSKPCIGAPTRKKVTTVKAECRTPHGLNSVVASAVVIPNPEPGAFMRKMTSSMKAKLESEFQKFHAKACTFWGLLSVLNDCNICVSPPLLEGALAHTGIAFRCGEDGEGVALDEEKFLRLAEHLMYDPALATSFYDDDRQLVELALQGEEGYVLSTTVERHSAAECSSSLFEALPELRLKLRSCFATQSALSGDDPQLSLDTNRILELMTSWEDNDDGAPVGAPVTETTAKKPSLKRLKSRSLLSSGLTSDLEPIDESSGSFRGLNRRQSLFSVSGPSSMSKLLSRVQVRKSFLHTLGGADGGRVLPATSKGVGGTQTSIIPRGPADGILLRHSSMAISTPDEVSDDEEEEPHTDIPFDRAHRSVRILEVAEEIAQRMETQLSSTIAGVSRCEVERLARKQQEETELQQSLLVRYQSAVDSFTHRRRTTLLSSLLPSEEAEVLRPQTGGSSFRSASADSDSTTGRQPMAGNSFRFDHSESMKSDSVRCDNVGSDSSRTRSSGTRPSTGRVGRQRSKPFKLSVEEQRLLHGKRVQSATLEREVAFLDSSILPFVPSSAVKAVQALRHRCHTPTTDVTAQTVAAKANSPAAMCQAGACLAAPSDSDPQWTRWTSGGRRL